MAPAPGFLFVYGTLRRGCEAPMQALLAQRADWAGTGTIAGLLYDVGDYPAAVPAGTGARVHGDLYRVADSDLLARLDEYEGCDATSPPPHEYRRVVLPVTRADGACVDAWVYLYAHDVSALVPIPSGDYLAWRRRG